MRKLFVTAIMLGLFAVTPAAFAQGDHNQGGKSDNAKSDNAKSGKAAGGQGHSGGNSAAHISDQGRANTNGPNATTRLHGLDRANQRRSAQGLAHSNDSNAKGRSNTNTRSLASDKAGAATHSAAKADRVNNAQADRTTAKTFTASRSANYSSLRRNVQSSRHFQAAAYRQPRGYVSRHWGYGERLPRDYFARDYWLMDYSMYALFAPPDGLVWVRVGDDALLIDEYTGEIVQVDYGVFA